MNCRKRVIAAIEHKKSDRVALDIGSTDVTGIHWRAYASLLRYLGIQEEICIWDTIQGLAVLSNQVRALLGIDTFGIWVNPTLTCANSLNDRFIEWMPDNRYRQPSFIRDEWGTVYRLPDHGYWYEPVKYPLSEANYVTVGQYAWPDPLDERKLLGVVQRARTAYEQTDYAVVANFSGALLARGQLLRGPAQFLMDLLAEPSLAAVILDHILEYNVSLVERYLDAIGAYIQVIKISDDLGTQKSLLISPQLYRHMIKPRQREFLETIRAHSKAAILYHSCGAIYPLIDDLIEIGIDILNPIQVSATGMDTAALGAKYGKTLCFWGGVDHEIMLSVPLANNQENPEIEYEVRQRLTHLARTGGYVCALSHNIQPNTPAINIMAFCKAVHKWGTYPKEESDECVPN